MKIRIWANARLRKLAQKLRESHVLGILESLGKLSIVGALLLYAWEYPDRVKQQELQAWQVINSSADKGGASVRDAVTYLVKRKVTLAQVNLARAYLHGLDLGGADLRGANLWGATLSEANLREVKLNGAVLDDANLDSATLADANLYGAYLKGAVMSWANLEGADLRKVSGLSQEKLNEACSTSNIKLTSPHTPPKADCSQITFWPKR